MKTLYEDNHLVIVEKPAGWATQPSPHSMQDAETALRKERNFCEAVHRLDKPTSGIVIFAKTSKALKRMVALVKERKIKKTYVALVEGVPELQGHLIHFLKKGDHRTQIVKSPEGKRAELTYRTLEQGKDKALIEVQLVTGRYHQIRAQLAAIGHPIVGDEKYGSKTPYQPKAIYLHHSSVTFTHPTTQKEIKISSSPQFTLKI